MGNGNRELAERHEILRAEVGSGLHGLALPGRDDRDEMGVTVEPPEYVIGTQQFEQYIYRDKPEGVRSEPGDLDLTIYSLRKYVRLAMAGNPSILLLLFAPASHVVKMTRLGRELQGLASAIVSQQAGPRFLGYLTAQKQRLLKERGTAHVPNRGDKDAKYASHMVRLGLQGVELLETGSMTLPMPRAELDWLRALKAGKVELDDALNEAGKLERKLKDLIGNSPIQEKPNVAAIDAWLKRAHMFVWTPPWPEANRDYWTESING